jgi:hypothetical protein
MSLYFSSPNSQDQRSSVGMSLKNLYKVYSQLVYLRMNNFKLCSIFVLQLLVR